MRKKIVSRVSDVLKIIKRSFKNFGSNDPMQMAGTTAYFALFSIVPILIIIISVFGLLTGDEAIRQKIFEELSMFVEEENTQFLERAVENYELIENSGIGAVIGILIFLFSATTLFSMIQQSINYIWRVKPRSNLKTGIFSLLKTRFFSFVVIFFLGLILLVSIIVDAVIAFFHDFLVQQFTPDFFVITQVVNTAISLAVVSTVFAVIYRYLPDVKVKWSASWFGAIFTAILFGIGRKAIGAIIGNSGLGQVYGAAGSIVIILVWVYFASIIFYFGVELTRQFSAFYHHENTPAGFTTPFEINRL